MALPPVPAMPDLSKATNGDETELYLSIDGEPWERVAETVEVDELPGGEQGTYETTHMTSGKFKEFKKLKRIEGVEIEVSGNYVMGSETSDLLKLAEESLEAVGVLFVLKQGDKTFDLTGPALCYSLKRSNPADATRRFTMTMKPVGEFVLTERAA